MKKIFFLIALCALFAGCKQDDGPVLPPAAASLTFPLRDQLCTQGTIISATQSAVTFKWYAAANTDNYDVTIKNLLTGVSTTQPSSGNQLTLSLDVNTPYSWFVVSRSSLISTTAQSQTWKFYNSGPGTVNYAPFPAEIVSPVMGEMVTTGSGKVTLDWNGSDTDNDSITYDVYFGNIATPPAYKNDFTDSQVSDVAATAGITYYWRVITKDNHGNTSDSGVYQFTAK